MKKLITLILLILTTLTYSQNNLVVDYSPSSEVIANPERGFHKFTETTSTSYSFLNQTSLNGYRTGVDKITMVYRGFYLESFMNSSISQAYLSNMQTDFSTLRNAGVKATIRFGYYTSSQTGPYQPSKAQIISHIQQLAPIINSNKDVILSIQIGFIGRWGEYYYTNSTEFGNGDYTAYTSLQWQNRKEVLDACFSNFDSSIFIQLRYPYAKTKMYGNVYIPRLGYFNDAFLNVYGDEGFFPICQTCTPSQSQINEVILQTENNPMTGETNSVNSLTNGTNAITQMDLFNWSIINRDYYPQAIQQWQTDGSFSTIINRLGYRFKLNKGIYYLNNNVLDVNISTSNEGFSKILKEKNVNIILKSSLNTYYFPLEYNVKNWGNNIIESINISGIIDGVYNVYLEIVDKDLPNNVNYKVHLANSNIWDSVNGYNDLKFTINKSGSGSLGNVLNSIPTLNVYPNPTTGIVYLPYKLSYKVYNSNNKLIKSGTGTQVNISNKPNGIYFLKIEGFQTIKIIKQ